MQSLARALSHGLFRAPFAAELIVRLLPVQHAVLGCFFLRDASLASPKTRASCPGTGQGGVVGAQKKNKKHESPGKRTKNDEEKGGGLGGQKQNTTAGCNPHAISQTALASRIKSRGYTQQRRQKRKRKDDGRASRRVPTKRCHIRATSTLVLTPWMICPGALDGKGGSTINPGWSFALCSRASTPLPPHSLSSNTALENK